MISLAICNRSVHLLCLLAFCTGCVSKSPSIAHTHIGHAITGVYNTPGEVGYLVLAQQLANAALAASNPMADSSADLATIKGNLAAIQAVNRGDGSLTLSDAVKEGIQHITYAATSPDASVNVVDSSRSLEGMGDGITARCQLIEIYTKDAADLQNLEELRTVAREVHALVRANLEGIDQDHDGVTGSTAEENGIRQVRQFVDVMIARESPPYSTVEKWYLLNLIRMPGGSWIFQKIMPGGSRGY